MFITINGQLGSGKSEVCRLLRDQKGYEIFSTGQIQREYAKELGISTLELNRLSKTDFSYDYAIDGKLRDFGKANEGKDVVFDSRMAWHFLPEALKVHLIVSPEVAADRVFFKRESTAEECYGTKMDALHDLIARRAVENERYNMVYNVSMLDFSNYHLVLDTTNLTPQETCAYILDAVTGYLADKNYRRILVSPSNVYPAKHLDKIEYKKIDDYIKSVLAHETLPPPELLKLEESLYILQGHSRIIAYNRLREKVIDALVPYGDDDILPSGVKPTDFVDVNMKDIEKWEEVCRIKFAYYPPRVRN